MNILISGASGLIGQALFTYLEQKGHHVFALNRKLQQGPFYWHPDEGVIHLDPHTTLDVVINLNGINVINI